MEYKNIIARIEDWFVRDLQERTVTAHAVLLFLARHDIAKFLTSKAEAK